jgi:hypothetical protein
MLLELVPIRRIHTAAEVRAGPLEHASRSIGALLAGRRVLVREHAFGPQIGELLIAIIAQEQCLSTVPDKYKDAMRDVQLVHRIASNLLPN